MKEKTYSKLREILNGLKTDDYEGLEGFASDCEMMGAYKTATYIRDCFDYETNVNLSLVYYHLSKDFTVC